MRSQGVTTFSQESIEQFRESLSVRGRSAHTVKSYGSDLSMLLLEAGVSSVPLEELEETGMRWLQSKRGKVSAKTITRRLTSLKAFARWVGMRDLFLDYDPPTPEKPQPKPLVKRMAGVRAMIKAADSDDMKAVVGLCGFAGLRIHEALSVDPAKVDFRAKCISILGKGEKWRTVPMSDELATILMGAVVRAWGKPVLVKMADRVARERITKLGVKAGLIRAVSSHHLRATFATTLMENGEHLRTVQELLGHASSKTTEAYTEVTMDRQRKAVNDL